MVFRQFGRFSGGDPVEIRSIKVTRLSSLTPRIISGRLERFLLSTAFNYSAPLHLFVLVFLLLLPTRADENKSPLSNPARQSQRAELYTS